MKYTAGFVHNVIYETYLKDHEAPEDIEYYMCGPGPMSKAVEKMLDDPRRSGTYKMVPRLMMACTFLLGIGSQRHFGVDNHFPFVGVFHDDVGLHLLPAFLVDDGFAPFVF